MGRRTDSGIPGERSWANCGPLGARLPFLLLALLAPPGLSACGGRGGSGSFGEVAASLGAPSASAPARGAADGIAPVSMTENDGDEASPRGDRKPLQAGLLTGASFDDTLNPDVYRKFLKKLGQHPDLGDLSGKFLPRQVVLTVHGSDGKPVGHARVKVSADGRSVDLVTRPDGRVVFVPAWDNLPTSGEYTVTITAPQASSSTQHTLSATETSRAITLPTAAPSLPRNLDLAIVFDTTGSMGDELEYLKTEIKGIAEAIHERFPQVNQRYALILYRDEGDDYVTRKFDFTASLDQFRKHLAAQSAGGGGDTPEAMHKALEDAGKLQWRTADTARVLFLVGDAPPHREFVGRTMQAGDALRKKGVAVYPVACSGYDDSAEFVMRSCALFTGGQFLFLTDDSGIGNPHAEPHIPCYEVQRLDQLMVRMIATELAGRRVEARPTEVLRRVGRMEQGVWRKPKKQDQTASRTDPQPEDRPED